MPLLRPCKNTAAFEAIPDTERMQVDLDALERTLIGSGWDLVVNAAVMLIVKGEVEVSIYRSGKMLIKTLDPDVAIGAYRAIYPHIDPEAPADPTMEGLERLGATPQRRAT